MTRRLLVLITLTLTLATLGCEKEAAEAEPTAPVAAEPTEVVPTAAPEAEQAAAQLAAVEVAPEGTKFEPPVQPEQLPSGAWYCDMGTVHWAAMEKPDDGNCPVCGMALKLHDPDKLAEQKKLAVEPHAHPHDEDGHDHADGEEHAHPAGDDGHGHPH